MISAGIVDERRCAESWEASNHPGQRYYNSWGSHTPSTSTDSKGCDEDMVENIANTVNLVTKRRAMNVLAERND